MIMDVIIENMVMIIIFEGSSDLIVVFIIVVLGKLLVICWGCVFFFVNI